MAREKARIRKSDGAVYVDGLGYVHELGSLGGREAAREAARQAIAENLAAQKSGKLRGRVGMDEKREEMGFG
ncbi:hypothetical protein KFU94_00875 [Chloroflexi bacterium TSY]|nr:hypothetical protein [Chloroflexi bacterium TSY]